MQLGYPCENEKIEQQKARSILIVKLVHYCHQQSKKKLNLTPHNFFLVNLLLTVVQTGMQ